MKIFVDKTAYFCMKKAIFFFYHTVKTVQLH